MTLKINAYHDAETSIGSNNRRVASMNIYTHQIIQEQIATDIESFHKRGVGLKPTYLYIKRHAVTGKLYFGKTIRSHADMMRYKGSGKYWKDHIKKHGKHHVETIWYCLYYTVEELVEFALMFSHQDNITESEDWANLDYENGLKGGCPSAATRAKTSITKRNKTPEANDAASAKYAETMSNKTPEEKSTSSTKRAETNKNKSPEVKAASNAKQSETKRNKSPEGQAASSAKKSTAQKNMSLRRKSQKAQIYLWHGGTNHLRREPQQSQKGPQLRANLYLSLV